MCGMCTDPVLRRFDNQEGLNRLCTCLVDVVPHVRELANGLRLGIIVPSHVLSRVWSPCMGESQYGQVPLHRTKQG
jgi:hypothetical protein